MPSGGGIDGERRIERDGGRRRGCRGRSHEPQSAERRVRGGSTGQTSTTAGESDCRSGARRSPADIGDIASLSLCGLSGVFDRRGVSRYRAEAGSELLKCRITVILSSLNVDALNKRVPEMYSVESFNGAL